MTLPVGGRVAPKCCSAVGCNKPTGRHGAKGFCGSHYRKWRRKNGLDPKTDKEYLRAYGRTLDGRYTALKRAAKDKDLGFDITREIHAALLADNICHYCTGSLNPTGHCLDRLDNTKGYLVKNVVVCCYSCNKIKGDSLTHEEMTVAMTAVLKLRELRECSIT